MLFQMLVVALMEMEITTADPRAVLMATSQAIEDFVIVVICSHFRRLIGEINLIKFSACPEFCSIS